jgi:hypothetical protein
MASCPDCGADITHAETSKGEHLPLEKWTEPTGDRRYRIVRFGPPMIAELVSASSTAAAYPDHRKDCPAHGNGLG